LFNDISVSKKKEVKADEFFSEEIKNNLSGLVELNNLLFTFLEKFSEQNFFLPEYKNVIEVVEIRAIALVDKNLISIHKNNFPILCCHSVELKKFFIIISEISNSLYFS
jgi:hypothetical protein